MIDEFGNSSAEGRRSGNDKRYRGEAQYHVNGAPGASSGACIICTVHDVPLLAH